MVRPFRIARTHRGSAMIHTGRKIRNQLTWMELSRRRPPIQMKKPKKELSMSHPGTSIWLVQFFWLPS